MTLDQLLRDGQAPNPTNNCTIAEARNLSAFLGELFPIHQIVINTTTTYPIEAKMEPAINYEIPADARLFFQLQVAADDAASFIGVANIQRVRREQGDQQAAVICINQIVPGWSDVPELAAKVTALLPYVPPVVVVDQPAPAMPDWENPKDDGCFAVRVGDLTPKDTKYTSANGVVWQKGTWLLPFNVVWKRVN